MAIVGARHRHGRVVIVMLIHLVGKPCLPVCGGCVYFGTQVKYRYYYRNKSEREERIADCRYHTVLTLAFLSVL